MPVDYTKLSPTEIHVQLLAIADEVNVEFSRLDAAAMNWRPDPARWSVANVIQ